MTGIKSWRITGRYRNPRPTTTPTHCGRGNPIVCNPKKPSIRRRYFPSLPLSILGLISPRQICNTVLESENEGSHRGENKFLVEIGWREFSYHLLYHYPIIPDQPLRPKYAAFPWLDDPKNLKRWQFGNTGYPMVDAGMRQLYQTSWMHNRVRMIVASFLVKHLLISWTEGARWFWDTLVDADLASNTQGWQWAQDAPMRRLIFEFSIPLLRVKNLIPGDHMPSTGFHRLIICHPNSPSNPGKLLSKCSRRTEFHWEVIIRVPA